LGLYPTCRARGKAFNVGGDDQVREPLRTRRKGRGGVFTVKLLILSGLKKKKEIPPFAEGKGEGGLGTGGEKRRPLSFLRGEGRRSTVPGGGEEKSEKRNLGEKKKEKDASFFTGWGLPVFHHLLGQRGETGGRKTDVL